MNAKKHDIYHENKKHTADEFPYNTYLCTIPDDFHEVMDHWHEDVEIIYIKKGRGIVSLDLTDHYVEGGDFVVVLPGQLHGIRSDEMHSMEYENILFSMKLLYSQVTDATDTALLDSYAQHKILMPGHITPNTTGYEKLRSCLDEADTICTTFPTGYQLAIKGQLCLFFYYLQAISMPFEPDVVVKNVDRIKSILEYVEIHYTTPISIEEIASYAGFSTSHFMKFFKQEMGITFISYLNQYRLSVAARLLLKSKQSILSISQECGFENISYFNRVFKNKYGLSPRDYRNR